MSTHLFSQLLNIKWKGICICPIVKQYYWCRGEQHRQTTQQGALRIGHGIGNIFGQVEVVQCGNLGWLPPWDIPNQSYSCNQSKRCVTFLLHLLLCFFIISLGWESLYFFSLWIVELISPSAHSTQMSCYHWQCSHSLAEALNLISTCRRHLSHSQIHMVVLIRCLSCIKSFSHCILSTLDHIYAARIIKIQGAL